MPYMLRKSVAGVTIEYERYYSYRYHPEGGKREKKKKPSTEAVKRNNQRMAARELRGQMNASFVDGDLLLTLDWRKEERPAGSGQMQKQVVGFLRAVRREYRKHGKDPRYIYVKEVGPKGGRHIHMVLSKEGLDVLEIVRKKWKHGQVHVDPLSSGGQYRKIADYFIKYAARTEETEGKLIGKRWYASRNICRPKVTKRVITANAFREQIRMIKGYVLEKDSVRSGISEVTGYGYICYTMIRIDKQLHRGKTRKTKKRKGG